jgi:hypothetical protein
MAEVVLVAASAAGLAKAGRWHRLHNQLQTTAQVEVRIKAAAAALFA